MLFREAIKKKLVVSPSSLSTKKESRNGGNLNQKKTIGKKIWNKLFKLNNPVWDGPKGVFDWVWRRPGGDKLRSPGWLHGCIEMKQPERDEKEARKCLLCSPGITERKHYEWMHKKMQMKYSVWLAFGGEDWSCELATFTKVLRKRRNSRRNCLDWKKRRERISSPIEYKKVE